MSPKKKLSSQTFKQALDHPQTVQYALRLYIAGNTPQSNLALLNLRRVCEMHLRGRYRLEVIDIRQQPELARDEQIIAAPTLVKRLPLPLRRIAGNMSQTERILSGLGLQPAG